MRPSTRASSSIALRRAATSGVASYPVTTAGLDVPATGAQPTDAPATADNDGADDHGEIAWRLRHMRRGILGFVATLNQRSEAEDQVWESFRDFRLPISDRIKVRPELLTLSTVR